MACRDRGRAIAQKADFPHFNKGETASHGQTFRSKDTKPKGFAP
jgi:hypothetical protein